ncbi:MAG: LytTR family DNA-binding domain-containing protein [Bacteroidales bacterium]|jgi:DNA-binding LytR/AlgR family response regulator|nr:LytTR family DNA-binding domain-containing protein [Bacteroidales bacterium]
MNVIVIEDELFAYKELERMLKILYPSVNIAVHFSSVKSAVENLHSYEADIIFMDISLPDGSCFDILNAIDITAHIVFTTAYDQYAIRAFKYNSIGYLLKPIVPEELKNVIDKHQTIEKQQKSVNYNMLAKALSDHNDKKRRFLVKVGDKYLNINVDNIAYFYSEDKVSFIRTFDGTDYITDYSLNDIEYRVDNDFFRVSRNMLCSIESVKYTSKYFNSRLKLTLYPEFDKEVIISRVKASEFLLWLDS